MTDLENKIWNLVSNWAEKQYHPINDFALRALMDEILKLVNESSKEAEIKNIKVRRAFLERNKKPNRFNFWSNK